MGGPEQSYPAVSTVTGIIAIKFLFIWGHMNIFELSLWDFWICEYFMKIAKDLSESIEAENFYQSSDLGCEMFETAIYDISFK